MLRQALHPASSSSSSSADNTPPVPGNGGTITSTIQNGTFVSLNWDRATDNITAQNELQYNLYVSDQPNISNVNDILANGSEWNGWQTDYILLPQVDLGMGVEYYFNVLVRDKALNISCYTMVKVTTETVPENLAFLDIDQDIGQVEGTLTFDQCPGENTIDNYVLYWGYDAKTKLSGPITEITASGAASYAYPFGANTVIPENAKSILIFTKKGAVESTIFAVCSFHDKGVEGKEYPSYTLNTTMNPFFYVGEYLLFGDDYIVTSYSVSELFGYQWATNYDFTFHYPFCY